MNAPTRFSGLNVPSLLETPEGLPRYRLEDLPARIGEVLGTSPWILIDQARIDAFAATTIDPQWPHVDVERAAAGPFKATIAHGFLTLSMVAWMGERAFLIDGLGMSLNYGLNKVRFPAPVPVDSWLRGAFRLLSCEPIEEGRGWQLCVEVTIERDGSDKPVCVAETLTRRYPAAA